ncbi:MAG: hypothetical protein KIT48_10420 [Pseudolabrys sp.]|nr:hypothetical protein [Pseudolabrys sp.]
MRSANLAVATAIVLAALGGAWAQDQVSPKAQDPAPVSPPAAAPETPKDIVPQPAGRFSLSRVEGGFLRLDSVTGHMSFCSPHTVGWACQAVPEDRAALDAEIARLQRELGKLKDEIAKAQLPPQPPRPPGDIPPQAGQDQNQAQAEGDAKLRFPSREEMERARTALERAWQHLVDMISEFQKDLTKKN